MKLPRAVFAATLVALVAKLLLAALTVGTNDVDTFYNFGKFIAGHGLIAQYRATTEFNHTPLVGWFVAGIYAVGQGFAFNLLLRLPGIVADFLSVKVLWAWNEEEGKPLPEWALVLFALSPVSLMVSGFHGNLDPVLAWLLLLAAREGARGRAGWCGAWFGLACQVKIIPLLLAPALFFFWMARGRARPFFWTATAMILVGWAAPLLVLPETFLRQVLGYSSNWGSWGVSWLLHASGWPSMAPVGFQNLTSTQVTIVSALKTVIVLGALGIGWGRRGRQGSDLASTLLMIWVVFFVFAPGVGAQYLVWFSPLLLLYSARWFAVVTGASAAFLFAFYTMICGGLPWYHGVSTAELLPRWVAWTALPWTALCALLVGMIAGKKSRILAPSHTGC